MDRSSYSLVVCLACSGWLGGLLAGCNGILGFRKPADSILYDAGASSNDAGSRLDGGGFSLRDAAASSVLDADTASSLADGRAADAAFPRIGGDAAVEDAGSKSTGDTRWARWPMPNPSSTGLANAQSYRTEADDLVTDQVTHLQWQQAVDDQLFTWNEAAAYCASFTLPGGAFRLPTRIELSSLLDFTALNSRIDADTFPDTPAEPFWTASPFVGDRSTAWVVNFGPGPGFVSSSELDTPYRVRCVR